MAKVLLIDDDRKHSELLKSYLKQFGISLECAGDAEEGMRKLSRIDPDLLLLDVMLPGRDGFDICREVRKSSQIPIIMLTARGDVVDRVSGLEIGADDYVGKPFEPRELVARIQTILRRATATDGRDPVLRFEGIEIDQDAKTVDVDGKRVELTSMEFELLVILARRAGKEGFAGRDFERTSRYRRGHHDAFRGYHGQQVAEQDRRFRQAASFHPDGLGHRVRVYRPAPAE